MNVFSPLRPGDNIASPTVWLDAALEAKTYPLPVPDNQLGKIGDGCVMRLASSATGADVLFAIGGADVVVTPDTGILFPAGSLETMGLRGASHIAVMAPELAEGATAPVNVTIGLGA